MERLLVKIGKQLVLVRTDEIDWIEAEGRYVRIHSNGHAYLYRQTLRGMERMLVRRPFLRINRFVMVNIERIREFQLQAENPMQVVLFNDMRWPFSRRYRHNMARVLNA